VERTRPLERVDVGGVEDDGGEEEEGGVVVVKGIGEEEEMK